MTIMKQSLCMLGVTAVVLLASCTRTVDRVERANPEATPHYVEDHRVLTPTGLHTRVRLAAPPREAIVDGDLLKIEVELENVRQQTERFLYAFEWFDQNGMSIREPQWRTGVVQGMQRITISDVAASPDAVDFRLHLRRAN
jgi:uncharacterized protein YcfL